MARNGVIGRAGGLPWRLPEDLRRFKALTLGKPIVMGRKTFDSIGRALPGRRNIVISRSAEPATRGEVCFVGSLAAALAAAGLADEIMVIGGSEIYRAALPHADRIYLTRVEAEVDGDVVFPDLPLQQWRTIASEHRPADSNHAYAMTFETLERISARAP